jgi:hypothetical protein
MEYSKKVEKESIFWHLNAGELHLTSKIIWEQLSSRDADDFDENTGLFYKMALARVFTMNAGLSIELILKACIIERYGLLGKKHCVHDLSFLSCKAGMLFSELELKQLMVFTEFISWAGRYPIGKKTSSYDLLIKNLLDLGIDKPWRLDHSPIDWGNYERIWKKCLRHFEGIGGGGEMLSDGTWESYCKKGLCWKVVEEHSGEERTYLRDFKTSMNVAEAFILAEKLNSERCMENGIYIVRYFTTEMQ